MLTWIAKGLLCVGMVLLAFGIVVGLDAAINAALFRRERDDD